MVQFAPNVFVAQYLKETNQSKPGVLAKAETFMLTGYQRQLTYRRNDGSFSAFGNNDKEGSLWLTAFVLKSFAQAKKFIYIDEQVQTSSRDWLARQQKSDGSFTPVGFVHNQTLLGGLKGNTALTAFLAVASLESGDAQQSRRAITYLENNLPNILDAYALALTSYALELANSGKANEAHQRLLSIVRQSDNGLYWGEEVQQKPVPPQNQPQSIASVPPRYNQSAAVETTAYALLALIAHGDRVSAGQAARWLVSQRNALGGWSSTQDTVVGLQALTKYAASSKSETEVNLVFRAGDWRKEVRVGADNADVLQLLDVPVAASKVSVEVVGKGQAVLQTVRRYNLPDPARKEGSAFRLEMDYGARQIQVSNQLTIKSRVQYTPPQTTPSGMVVLEVALPTGFAAVEESLAALSRQQPRIKRYDTAGRKVELYIDELNPNETFNVEFKVTALFPVKAQAVTSQVYSYYNPEWRGENLGGAVEVRA